MDCWPWCHSTENSGWKAQNTDDKLVYLLINVKKGSGGLLSVYDEREDDCDYDDDDEKDGSKKDNAKLSTKEEAAVRKLCEKKVNSCLYNEGERPHNVTYEDHTQWCSDRQIKWNIKEAEFSEHKACWTLESRGAVGETALHLCVLKNSDKHREIARLLLDLYPLLSLDVYEGEEYYGESALHFAVTHGDIEFVELLVEKGANINQRATGRFFLPEDQKTSPNVATSNYEGDTYFGEYPLAFAAGMGFREIYDYLISKGADPNLQDSFGNTVLHLTVIKNKSAMYHHAVKHPITKADQEKRNYYRAAGQAFSNENPGLTPLGLACMLGRQEVFNEIMDIQKMQLWRFSKIHCCIYSLRTMDTIGENGAMNLNSALTITLSGETEKHVDMLQSGVLKYMLDQKWKIFVKRRFFLLLALLVFHLFSLTTSVYLRRGTKTQLLTEARDVARLVMEIFTVIVCLTFIVMYILEIRFVGIHRSLVNLTNAPFKAIYLISCILQLTVIPLRLASIAYITDEAKLHSLQLGEESLLIPALPMCWSMLFFFTNGNVQIGPLSNFLLIYLKKDLLPIFIIIMIAYTGFAVSFYNMFKSIPPDQEVDTFHTPYGALMNLYHYTLGDFEYEEFQLTKYPVLTMLVFVLFMFLLPILLLNMLIAMMSSTFGTVMRKSKKDWTQQWAKIIIVLERTFSDNQLLQYQKLYSEEIDDPLKIHKGIDREAVKGTEECRRLMVIEATDKSKEKKDTKIELDIADDVYTVESADTVPHN